MIWVGGHYSQVVLIIWNAKSLGNLAKAYTGMPVEIEGHEIRFECYIKQGSSWSNSMQKIRPIYQICFVLLSLVPFASSFIAIPLSDRNKTQQNTTIIIALTHVIKS